MFLVLRLGVLWSLEFGLAPDDALFVGFLFCPILTSCSCSYPRREIRRLLDYVRRMR